MVVPRQDPVDWVVMLRNYENKERYICINRKGQIKAHKVRTVTEVSGPGGDKIGSVKLL